MLAAIHVHGLVEFLWRSSAASTKYAVWILMESLLMDVGIYLRMLSDVS